MRVKSIQTKIIKERRIMKQKNLANWLKLIIVGIAVCGLIVYAGIFPMYGRTLADTYKDYSHAYVPWLVFIYITAIPCYTVLVFCWQIASNIGADRSFSQANAKLLKRISFLAAADSLIFFAGNIIYLLLDMNHPSIVLLSLIIVFVGIAISVAAAALSHLVNKAAELQEQSDLTI